MGYLDNLTAGQMTLLEEQAEQELARKYWEEALDLVYAWGDYLHKKKLYINSSYAETAAQVQDVVNSNYFKGNKANIKKCENKRSELVDSCLDRFNNSCRFQSVEPVDRNWLFNFLRDGDDTKKLRGKIRTRLNKCAKAESLRDLV